MAKRLGKYLLIDTINHGGMADVWIAKDFGMAGASQIVAIKCIRPDLCADSAFIEMFVTEAKLSVLLNHEHIAKTFELGKGPPAEGQSHPQYYIAMEHVSGRDLRTVLDRLVHRGIELPPHLALNVVLAVLSALDYAHSKTDPAGNLLNIVHRDISPQNVMLGFEGAVKLIDFGIAQATDVKTGESTALIERQTGVIKGKYGYMAPEQIRGLGADLRSDIFAVGVLLYEVLTHRRLFEGASDYSILEKVRYAEVYPPTLFVPDLPKELEAVVLRALRLVPNDRYASAGEMHDALATQLLKHYGQPSPRELANLMQDLFAEEMVAAAGILEKARKIVAMPDEYSTKASVTTDADDIDENAKTRIDTRNLVEELKRLRPEETPMARPSATESSGGAAETKKHQVPSHVQEAVASQVDTHSEVLPDTDPEIPAPVEATQTDFKLPPEPLLLKKARPVPQAVDNPFLGAQGQPRAARPTVMPQPTGIHQAYAKPRKDILMVLAAAVVALVIVVATWVLTGGTPKHGQMMVFSVPPGASVHLDGRLLGRTPYTGFDVPVGAHTLEFVLDGYGQTVKDIIVSPKETLSVHVVLQAKGDESTSE